MTLPAVGARVGALGAVQATSRAVQVEPIKPTLKAPGPQRLKLEFDGLLSNFAFKLNLRRYNPAVGKKAEKDNPVGWCRSTLLNPS
jgi:hypothetical protein